MPRILIVADDADLRETFSRALIKEGFSVDHATEGHQALAALREGSRPDAIVLNIMMRDMSGWQFRAEQLRIPELASIPTIVITATGNVAHTAIDADEILPKPVTPEHLLATLRRHLPVETDPKLRALTPEESVPPAETLWQLVPGTRGETLKWQDENTSRWIAVSLGRGTEIGAVIVEDSTGWRQVFERYEDALELCTRLRRGRVLAG